VERKIIIAESSVSLSHILTLIKSDVDEIAIFKKVKDIEERKRGMISAREILRRMCRNISDYDKYWGKINFYGCSSVKK